MADTLFEVREGGIGWITLNRPESLNSMGGELMPLLGKYLAECSEDHSIRCVVLTGNGRAFCAGGDVKGMAARAGPTSDLRASGNGEAASDRKSDAWYLATGVQGLREGQRATSYVLHTMPKPTIAMVNGHAVGAGLSLALACDLRIASDRAKLGTVFRNVGFSGDFGGSWFLPRLVGMEKARELYFTGEILEAAEAKRVGMVSRVVPHEELEAETMKLASLLASGPTLAYARMKENLNRTWSQDLGPHLDQEALNMRLSGGTMDHREAAKSFVEKRAPVFKGE
jgi:2-(1,2-epoxy-1,2-dihydrophenyl)acetyl-CoA isomerase